MLIVSTGEDKSMKVGVNETVARERFKQLMDMFTLYPTEICIYNKTKTCKVEVQVIDNRFKVTVTNPEDEVFKL
jgi:hypothetical protein